MTDIKRVLAYSTISQLGYMMLALGVGGYVAAIFHLFTHAFFKALLFLGAGSVNHATNTFDMRLMGGLRKTMPVTFATFRDRQPEPGRASSRWPASGARTRSSATPGRTRSTCSGSRWSRPG